MKTSPARWFKIGWEKPCPDEGRTLMVHAGFATVHVIDCSEFFAVLTSRCEAVSKAGRAAGVERMTWTEWERLDFKKIVHRRFRCRWRAVIYGLLKSTVFPLTAKYRNKLLLH